MHWFETSEESDWLGSWTRAVHSIAAAEVEPFSCCFLSPSTKGNRAELCPCRHRAGPGCRKLITGFIKTWIDSFRPPCPSCFSRVHRRWLGQRGRQRGRETERESPRLRQMPHSSHRGYFVTSKWPFWLLQAQDVNVPQELIARSKGGILAPAEHWR